jgi:hypothetical protein
METDKFSSVTWKVTYAITTWNPLNLSANCSANFTLNPFIFPTEDLASDLFKRCSDIQIFIYQCHVLRFGPHTSATSRVFPYVLSCFHGAIHICPTCEGFSMYPK